MNNLVEQLRAWWDSASASTRIMGVGLVIVLAASLIVAVEIASAPAYQDLFTNLNPQDAASIAQKLDDEHEKYQMADNDTTIQVPAQDKDRLRMDMVRAGLPAKTGSLVSTDYLSNIGISTGSEVQEQYIRMEDESELSQTIGSLSPVATASVHLAPGNNSPLLETATPASASVVIDLKPGQSLDNDQVMGIANLVAKSVPDLDAKNVVVMDGTGTQLWPSDQTADGFGGPGGGKLSAEQQFAEVMRKQMQSYLDMVLGSHKSLVSVNAELDYDQVHSDATIYSKGQLTAAADTSETYQGNTAAGEGGVAGSSANTPTGNIPSYSNSNGTNGGKYDKTDEDQNYEPSKTETETTRAPGSIKRLAIAVLVDQSIPAAAVASITNWINTFVGVSPTDPTRSVTVQTIAFSTAQTKDEATQVAAAASAQRMDMLMKVAAVAAAIIAVLFIFTRSSKTFVVTHSPLLTTDATEVRALDGPHMGDSLLEDREMSIDEVLADMPEIQRRKRAPLAGIEEIEEQHDAKLESIKEMVHSHPQSVALLLKGWLAEDAGAF